MLDSAPPSSFARRWLLPPPLLGCLVARCGTGLVGVLLSAPTNPLLLRMRDEPPTPLPLPGPNSAPLLVLPKDPTIPSPLAAMPDIEILLRLAYTPPLLPPIASQPPLAAAFAAAAAAAVAAAKDMRGESTGLLHSARLAAVLPKLLARATEDIGGLAALRLDCGGCGCSCGVLALLLPGQAMPCGVLLALPPLLLPGARGLGLKRDWLCWWDDGDSSSTDDYITYQHMAAAQDAKQPIQL